jgi:hypothetical protein
MMMLAWRTTQTKNTDAATNACNEIVKLCISGIGCRSWAGSLTP